jgi:hypothetical protein
VGSDAIGKQIVAKWRQNLGAIAEGIKIRDELSDEVDSLRRKLQAANRQILKMADPSQLGELNAEVRSSVREQAQARWTRPEGDEWDSGDDYERVVTELKSKCYKQPSRVRSILSSSD